MNALWDPIGAGSDLSRPALESSKEQLVSKQTALKQRLREEWAEAELHCPQTEIESPEVSALSHIICTKQDFLSLTHKYMSRSTKQYACIHRGLAMYRMIQRSGI